ncbi:type II secretion system F family protein [Haloarcula pelagica]|uniref:type II secretion system F family protein n=1 Tax=Haloarcula pelagica TaxID=3033389 RepID=UPI0024C42FC4|nr:type II secretion system F family protein [Halomicroarcula sp. YJ-61-S]
MSLGTSEGAVAGYRRHSEQLRDLFYPLYDWLFSEDSAFVVDLDETLSAARINVAVDLYLTGTLALGVAVGVALWLCGSVATLVVVELGLVDVGTVLGVRLPNETVQSWLAALRVPLLVLFSGFGFGLLGLVSVFCTAVAYPYSLAAQRRREIDMLLSDAVSYMYALSVGGMSQLEILEAMAEAEDTYGEVAREFRTIMQETTYFDTDYRTAIRNRSVETPSDDFGQFLTDMLSIINSGGSMNDFLEDKKDLHFRTTKEEQQRTLETLELFGEMYITLSLFPLLLVIILVIMQLMGQSNAVMLFGTVYLLIPLTGVGFLVLVSTVKQDAVGSGYLEPDRGSTWVENDSATPLKLGLIRKFTGRYRVFDRIKHHQEIHETVKLLSGPHHFFRENPVYTLWVTGPVALAYLGFAILTGMVPVTWAGMVDQPVWSTVNYAYVPLFVTCLPLAVFREWNVRSRRAVLTNLSENLRKLASANATGLTLTESIRMVAETSSDRLAAEFGTIYAKSRYGMDLTDSLIVFNNKYHIPRLARTVTLVSKAYETSNEISTVLSTAAQATEAQDDIARERKSRSRMQVAVILMTFLTLLGVMAILKTQFIDVMAKLTEQTGGAASQTGFGGAIDLGELSLLFFHAVTIQAILSGLICGYIRDASVLSGVKYVVGLLSLALTVWVMVG